MGQFTFRKKERLKKEKDIQELFNRGSSFYLFPFKVITLPGASTTHKVLISVSKRTFPRAVDRNLLKRRIREAFRLQKSQLPPGALYIGFIYTHKEKLASSEIFQKMVHVVKRLNKISEPPAKHQ